MKGKGTGKEGAQREGKEGPGGRVEGRGGGTLKGDEGGTGNSADRPRQHPEAARSEPSPDEGLETA